MVAVIEGPDIGQRVVGVFTGQIHCHLPGKGNRPFPGPGLQVLDRYIILAADQVPNHLAVHLHRGPDKTAYHLPDQRDVRGRMLQA